MGTELNGTRPPLSDVTVCDVYGAGGHAQVVVDVLRARGIRVRRQYNDMPSNQHPASVDVHPGVRLADAGLSAFLDVPVVMAVGRNGERAELVAMMTARYLRAVHPSALIASSARIGEGTVVLHGAIVQPNARIGRHVLVNTAASVDHDCVVGDFAHISPHATLCGHVQVGEGTHVGAGAVAIPKVRIGRWCRVGAGAVVLTDVPDHTTVVGNPARVVPDRTGEPPPDRTADCHRGPARLGAVS
ncbi:Putative acetyltransferase [Modestobacter italicus]|uniref:Acetyltransferase n=1 Tax=Modestobacter italicus (strain DSM 44449 / CECT 9708 / BC 501) TaxID=2732864 RepID=I4EXK1_MODI5|nr:acetyltransferase [Modestobacter marinus]CCH88114.1 Putative acetyltransferase [Modestobacter marinus]